jgi:hypothetical protein
MFLLPGVSMGCKPAHRRPRGRLGWILAILTLIATTAGLGSVAVSTAQAAEFCPPAFVSTAPGEANDGNQLVERSNCGNTVSTLQRNTLGAPSLSPDGKVVAGFSPYIRVRAVDDSFNRQISDSLSDPTGGNPSWLPSSDKFAFSGATDTNEVSPGHIYAATLESGALVQLTSGTGNDTYPAVSPGGGKIAFARSDASGDCQSCLMTMNADGSSQTQLFKPSSGCVIEASAWTPDGKAIVFGEHCASTGHSVLYVINAAGGIPVLLPILGPDAFAPTISRDWVLGYTNDNALQVVQPIADAAGAIVYPEDLHGAGQFIQQGVVTAAPAGFPPSGNPQPKPLKIGAWGDSYISGEGAKDPQFGYMTGTDVPGNHCHRSVRAFPVLIAKSLKRGLDFHACSGAVLADYTKPYAQNHEGKNANESAQRDTVSKQDDIGFLVLDGNNIDFAGVMQYCATRAVYQPTCEHEFGKRVNALLDKLRNNNTLVQTYKDLVSRMAPSAKLYVIGYPRFFPVRPPGSCWTGATLLQRPVFTRADMVWINNAITSLNVINMKASAKVKGVKFIDTYDVFTGHELCNTHGAQAWMNKAISNLDEYVRAQSFHPNVQGHKAEAAWVGQRMN